MADCAGAGGGLVLTGAAAGAGAGTGCGALENMLLLLPAVCTGATITASDFFFCLPQIRHESTNVVVNSNVALT